MTLSSPPVAGVWWEHTPWLALWRYPLPPVAGVWWAHILDWLYDSLSAPPVAGVWWVHSLDWLYDSLSSPPVAGCGESIHLIGSMTLSSPPVAGVWWAHTLDWLYDSLSSPPVAGVWWAHTLDWLYDSILSTCGWCVVSAYTWLALWLYPLHLWLVCGERIHLIGSMTLSSPPVAGEWWAQWRRCPVAAVASSKWMLHTGGGWGETPPPHDCKVLWVYNNTQKALYTVNASFIHSFHSFIHSFIPSASQMSVFPRTQPHLRVNMPVPWWASLPNCAFPKRCCVSSDWCWTTLED